MVETKRTAVIDIGSNSVRLVVFDGPARSPSYFYNEKAVCALGAGMVASGVLNPDGKARTRRVLDRFATIIGGMNCAEIHAVATAAMREARDGNAFSGELERMTGLPVRVVSGAQEGRYAAYGVLLGDPRSEGVVADIGGTSMELTLVRKGVARKSITTALGPQALVDFRSDPKALRTEITQRLTAAGADAFADETLILVGGAWRALAAVEMARRSYPLRVLQGFEITLDSLPALADFIAERSAQTLAQDAQIALDRAVAAPFTLAVLERLVAQLSPERISLSAYGLREGVLFENLSPAQRQSDPLVAGSRFMEQMSARAPGLGEEIAAWVEPALPDVSRRMVLAASLLADVNWRTHPDYRARACFDTAMQSNLGALTHEERVFLAVALAYRYKRAGRALKQEVSVTLLPDSQKASAKALGRLIRLAAMLGATKRGVLQGLKLERTETELRLSIPPENDHLHSETVTKRLGSAADALGLAPQVL